MEMMNISSLDETGKVLKTYALLLNPEKYTITTKAMPKKNPDGMSAQEFREVKKTLTMDIFFNDNITPQKKSPTPLKIQNLSMFKDTRYFKIEWGGSPIELNKVKIWTLKSYNINNKILFASGSFTFEAQVTEWESGGTPSDSKGNRDLNLTNNIAGKSCNYSLVEYKWQNTKEEEKDDTEFSASGKDVQGIETEKLEGSLVFVSSLEINASKKKGPVDYIDFLNACFSFKEGVLPRLKAKTTADNMESDFYLVFLESKYSMFDEKGNPTLIEANFNFENIKPGKSSDDTANYNLKFSGTALEEEKKKLVVKIEVIDRIDKPSEFTIYVHDTKEEWSEKSTYSEGTDVIIEMGFGKKMEQVIEGEVTGISVQYSKEKGYFFIIKGSGLLHRLTRGKMTAGYVEKKYSDIAGEIIKKGNLSPTVTSIGETLKFTMQHNQTGHEYLEMLAGIYNFHITVSGKKLTFDTLKPGDSPAASLTWKKDLNEFFAETDTTPLLTEVEVRGWDVEKSEALSGKATSSQIKDKVGGGKVGVEKVKSKYGEGKTVFIDKRIGDKTSAEAIALNIITANSMLFAKARGSSKGNSKIKAGKLIEIKGVTKTFEGKWYIKSATHMFELEKGYNTSFELVRNCAG